MPEWGAEGLLINSRLGIPSIVRFHSPSRLTMPCYDVPGVDVTMCSCLEQRAIQRATALTSCSAFLAGEVRGKMAVRNPINVIPNGIDLSLFDQEDLIDVNSKYGVPKGRLTIF